MAFKGQKNRLYFSSISSHVQRTVRDISDLYTKQTKCTSYTTTGERLLPRDGHFGFPFSKLRLPLLPFQLLEESHDLPVLQL